MSPYMKINSTGIKDPNIRAKMIKLLEENIGANLYDLGLSGQWFLRYDTQSTSDQRKSS